MATCLDIITDALKLARVIGSGEEPSAAEGADGMIALQSLYDGMVFGGMFGELEDVYLEENEYALEGKRYYVPAGITLTAATNDYEDAEGVVRQPRDLALYESLTADGTRSVKLYDRTAWVELTGLTTSSTAPLAERDRLGLAAALACSAAFAAMFGDATISPRVERLSAKFMGRLMSPASTQDSSGADYY